jgi:hypothetical protein
MRILIYKEKVTGSVIGGLIVVDKQVWKLCQGKVILVRV